MVNGKITLEKVYDLISEFRNEVRDVYVTKAEFWSVRAITYGLIGVVGIAVLMALISGVLK